MAQTLTKYTTNQTISVYIAKLKNKFVQTQIFSENISNSKVMFAKLKPLEFWLSVEKSNWCSGKGKLSSVALNPSDSALTFSFICRDQAWEQLQQWKWIKLCGKCVNQLINCANFSFHTSMGAQAVWPTAYDHIQPPIHTMHVSVMHHWCISMIPTLILMPSRSS